MVLFGGISSYDFEVYQPTKVFIQNEFQTKDFGSLKYSLVIEVAQSTSGIVISQWT